MKSEKLEIIKIKNICKNITDGTHNSPKKVLIGKPLVTSKHLKDGKILYEEANLISKEDFDKINERSKVFKWDILISMIGTVGELALVKEEPKFAIKNIGLFNIGDENLAKWVYYSLKSSKGQEQILKNLRGSTQQYITLGELRNLEIWYPEIKKREKIVSILSSLDEKIELNRKINQNLEEIVQTLFKRWFIDFEFPNEEGKPYKSSGGKMIESELGEIPEGWRVGKLGEIIEIFDSLRKPLSKKERDLKEKLYPYYGAAGIIDYVDEYLFDGEYILLGEDGTVVSEKGTPILNFIQEKFWVSNHAHVIIEKNKDNSYLYYLLKNTDIRHIITGAVQPKINQKNLIELKVTISQEELVKKFSNIISNITLKIRNNQKEIKKLTELRDYLLPRLMSGEISV